MKFEIENSTGKLDTLKVTDNKLAIDKKTNFTSLDGIEIDSSIFQNKLYGNNKKESQTLQGKNCKEVFAIYKKLKKAIKLLKRKKCPNYNKLFAKNLNKKTNNNDFMLSAMLELRFCRLPVKRFNKAYYYAGEYLDKENEMNNMCDFKDGQCINHRTTNNTAPTGCCPSFCKYTSACVCPHKNLSCKIFMCSFLIDKGYYFAPNAIPILKNHLTFAERCACFSLICRKGKTALRLLWAMRIATIFLAVFFALVVAAIICL